MSRTDPHVMSHYADDDRFLHFPIAKEPSYHYRLETIQGHVEECQRRGQMQEPKPAREPKPTATPIRSVGVAGPERPPSRPLGTNIE